MSEATPNPSDSDPSARRDDREMDQRIRVSEHVRKLERRLRRAWLIGTLWLAFGAAGLFVLADYSHLRAAVTSGAAESVVARRFTLVDDSGTAIAKLHDGAPLAGPTLSLRAQDQSACIDVGFLEGGFVGIGVLKDCREKSAGFSIGLGDGVAPYLAMYDSKGRMSLLIGIGPGDEPQLSVSDSAGNARFVIDSRRENPVRVFARDGQELGLCDPQGKPSAGN